MDRKVYNRTYWVDHETPVNAENLNKIEKAIYDLSEQSIRPSDFVQKEDSAITITTECGKINFDVNSTVLKTNGTIDSFGVINETTVVDETKNDLYVFINDLMENKVNSSYRLFYRGVEYFPEEVKSNSVVCENGKSLEEHLSDTLNSVTEELSANMEGLRAEVEQSLTNFENEVIPNQLAAIQKKLNTLSLKIDMLESMINDLMS